MARNMWQVMLRSRDLPRSQIPALSTARRSPIHRSDQKFLSNILWDFSIIIEMSVCDPSTTIQYYQSCHWIDTEIEINEISNLKQQHIIPVMQIQLVRKRYCHHIEFMILNRDKWAATWGLQLFKSSNGYVCELVFYTQATCEQINRLQNVYHGTWH